MSPQRRLLLVRHGETEGQSSVRFHGRGDVPLSALGREQAARLAARLRGEPIDRCFHSPLSRARETAEIVVRSASRAFPLHAETDLREIDFGVMEGLTLAEMRLRDPSFVQRFEQGRHTEYPGGDSVDAFRRRAGDAVERCLAQSPDPVVLLVAHRGVLLAALARLVPDHGGELRRFVTELGCLCELWLRDQRWSVRRWNEGGA